MSSGPPTDSEIQLLRQLARDSRSADAGPEPRTSDQAIWAFASGTASEEQRAEVIRALMAFPSLRREFLDLWHDIEAVRSGDPTRMQLPTSIDQRAVRRIMGIERPSLWRRVVEFLAADRLMAAAAGAAATAAILFITMGGPGKETTSVVLPAGSTLSAGENPEMVRGVDPSVFDRESSRGPEDDMTGVSGTRTPPALTPTNGEEAALLAFYGALETLNGEIAVRDDTPAVVRPYLIRFAYAQGSYIDTHWQVPVKASDLVAWAMGLPSGSLLRIPILGDTTIVAWDTARWGTRAPACVTFKLDGADQATPVQEFHLRQPSSSFPEPRQ